MLSEWEEHLKIPRNLEDNKAYRKRVLERCYDSDLSRAAALRLCKNDLLFYVNTFVWQFNPQHFGNEVGPFITWPIQEISMKKILWCIEHRKDMRMAKSREMGASWMCLIVMDWLYQFHGDKKFLMISRNEKAVDDRNNSDSLFWKLDFMHAHLPGWLRPDEKRTKLAFTLRGHHAGITGEASTGYSGSGGRAAAAFIDEFSKIEDDFELMKHLGDTSQCRIFNFTHTGVDTAAYAICNREKYPNMEEVRLHWSDHPEKNQGLYQYNEDTHRVDVIDKTYSFPPNFQYVMDGKIRSPWYDNECDRRGHDSTDIAMNLDIDPKGSARQFFESYVIEKLKREFARPPLWEGDLEYDHQGKPQSFVPRAGGPLRLWVNLRDGMPPRASYGMGGDIAEGTGATPSCLSIVSRETGEKVAEYADARIDPISLAPLAVALCRAFGDTDEEGAAFAWEMQGPGRKFGEKVIGLGYRNIYFHARADFLTKKTTDIYGWYPSPDAKDGILKEYRFALIKRDFINHSEPALEECLDFSYQSNGHIEHGGAMAANDPTGARVNHGDRVIADALAWHMVQGSAKSVQRAPERPPGPASLAGRRRMAENADREVEAWY